MVEKVGKCPQCGSESGFKASTPQLRCPICDTSLELPGHWLRKYLLKTTLGPLIFILIGGILAWINKESSNALIYFWIFGGIGVFMAVFASLAYADETPLRKYKLIHDVSWFFRNLWKGLGRIQPGGPPEGEI